METLQILEVQWIPYFMKISRSGGNYLPITDKRMTRFYITLNQSTDFVLGSLKIMQGG